MNGYTLLIVLGIVVIWQFYQINKLQNELKKQRDSLTQQEMDWMRYADELRDRHARQNNDLFTVFEIERQSLLDRIQAPTFAEYKHQEAKVIKAKNGTDKPDIVYEQL